MKESKKATQLIRGTIVGASHVQSFRTQHGKVNQSAMLHIQENCHGQAPHEVAVKVSGDLCNYVGCIGISVVVEYTVRVFEFVKNGIRSLGNDVYALDIRATLEP